MKHLLSDLIRRRPTITRLEVQSFEMNLYLVKAEINGVDAFVYNDADRPMRFHSSQHVRETFAEILVEHAVMLHNSPYDEMIGNPNKPEASAELPFSMNSPY